MSQIDLRPSNAHRWLACPGSAKLETKFPDYTTKYAEEGTAAHEVAAWCLEKELEAKFFLGKTANGIVVKQDMVNNVQEYLDYVREFDGQRFIEQSLSLGDDIRIGGTADCLIIKDGHAHIIDLKYGQGVLVKAEGNEQLLTYAVGLLNCYDYMWDLEHFTLVIVQPRKFHIDTWTVSKQEVLAHADRIKKGIEKVNGDNPEYVPGEKQCRFCKAKASCRALAKFNIENITGEFKKITEPLTPLEVPTLTVNELAHLLSQVNIITDWVKSIEARVNQEALTGVSVPGYKLVRGRGSRKWRDENTTLTTLKKKRHSVDSIAPRKLLSVAQMEKHLGKKKFKELSRQVNVIPGRITLAPESDKRQEIDPSIGDDLFEDITT